MNSPTVRARPQVDRSLCAPICLFLSRYPSTLPPILLNVTSEKNWPETVTSFHFSFLALFAYSSSVSASKRLLSTARTADVTFNDSISVMSATFGSSDAHIHDRQYICIFFLRIRSTSFQVLYPSSTFCTFQREDLPPVCK